MIDIEKKLLISQIKVLLLKLKPETGIKLIFNIPGNVKDHEKIKAEITEQI